MATFRLRLLEWLLAVMTNIFNTRCGQVGLGRCCRSFGMFENHSYRQRHMILIYGSRVPRIAPSLLHIRSSIANDNVDNNGATHLEVKSTEFSLFGNGIARI